jgi:hypothetical protein
MATLYSLTQFASVSEAFAAPSDEPLEAVRPTLRIDDGGRVFAETGDGRSIEIPRSMLG